MYPEVKPIVGEVPPAPEAVAEAVTRARGATAQVSEATAANALGLSTHVPAREIGARALERLDLLPVVAQEKHDASAGCMHPHVRAVRSWGP